jgi:HAD superfamily hydrolase (TIGR01509 family)
LTVNRALVFDFDGTLVDTETVEYESWRKVFSDHGQDLKPEEWIHVIGGVEVADFKVELETRLGNPILQWDEIHEGRLEHHRAMMETKGLLPGVARVIEEGKRRGYRLGLASSSPDWWVEKGLKRYGLIDVIEARRTRENSRRHKPDPWPYAAVLRDLGAGPAGSIGFEDSEKGVASGKAAGLHMIAVPNGLTRLHDLSAADQQLDSLEQFIFPD